MLLNIFAPYKHLSSTKGNIAAIGMFLAVVTASVAPAQVVYNSIPAPLPGNVLSSGFEADGLRELGDGVNLAAGTGRSLTTVTVIMSSFACTSGNWFTPAGNANVCVTTPGATFNQSITLNIYAVGPGGTTGPLIKTVTQTFAMPYRPSTNPTNCGAGTTQWFDAADNTCYNGFAFRSE